MDKIASGQYFVIGIDGKKLANHDREILFIRILDQNFNVIQEPLALFDFDKSANAETLALKFFNYFNNLVKQVDFKHENHNFCWSSLVGISADTTSLNSGWSGGFIEKLAVMVGSDFRAVPLMCGIHCRVGLNFRTCLSFS